MGGGLFSPPMSRLVSYIQSQGDHFASDFKVNSVLTFQLIFFIGWLENQKRYYFPGKTIRQSLRRIKSTSEGKSRNFKNIQKEILPFYWASKENRKCLEFFRIIEDIQLLWLTLQVKHVTMQENLVRLFFKSCKNPFLVKI